MTATIHSSASEPSTEQVVQEAAFIDARAGSGKSTVIVKQTAYYAQSDRCLLLSFSQAGADVLNNYLKRLDQDFNALIRVYTVDKFANVILQNLNDYRFPMETADFVRHLLPELAQRACDHLTARAIAFDGQGEAMDFVAPQLNESQMGLLFRDLEFFRSSLAFEAEDSFAVQEICEGNLHFDSRFVQEVYYLYEDMRARWRPEYSRHWSAAQQTKLRNYEEGFRLIGDAVYDVMQYDSHTIAAVVSDIDRVFIDEFHDITPLQLEFIKRICQHKKSVMAVGDRFQNIFAWRATNTDVVFQEFLRYFHGVVVQQKHSHRFGARLSALCAQITQREVLSSTTYDTQIEYLPLQPMAALKLNPHCTALLAQDYVQLLQAVFGLWQYKPAQSELKFSFALHNCLVVHLLNLMYALKFHQFLGHERQFKFDAERFFNSHVVNLSDLARQELLEDFNLKRLQHYMRLFMQSQGAPLGQNEEVFSQSFKAVFMACLRQDHITIVEILRSLVEQGRIFTVSQGGVPSRFDTMAWQLFQQAAGQQGWRLSDWPTVFGSLLRHWKKKGGVPCMTVAQAKGREFDTVFLYGADEHGFLARPDGTEVSRNEFYVGITRCKKKLVLINETPQP
ncbi:UvrD-helicase domain-containing protein [Brackiella oedipodis]|uniref:UvrD-helicase domain-containing protein n=1 Tax=Brackiella oedipodis TaxID=124225 RepID=UPI00048F2040|nr:UvrD-helicase domain-containing protein [Brackiella oedipodis]